MVSGKPGLNIFERRRLAQSGDDSLAAVARRLRSTRLALGLDPEQVRLGIGWNTDLGDVLKAEAGVAFPQWFHTEFFRSKYGIRDDFFIEGDISLLPADVEPHIFARLSSV